MGKNNNISNNNKSINFNNNSNDNNVISNSLASCFFNLSPKQFTLLSTLLGIVLIDDLDLNQQNSLGNFLVGVGQAILIAAAQGQGLQSSDQQNNHIRKQIQSLKDQICALEDELDS